MCKELTKELDRGKLLATLLVEHLDDMSAEQFEIPVTARGKNYVCECYPDKPKQCVIPDIDGSWRVGWVTFKQIKHAEEFKDALNQNKTINTPIAFHVDECPGCVHLYFSREKQEIIAVCNECGLKRQLRLNVGDNDIIGWTSKFEEALTV